MNLKFNIFAGILLLMPFVANAARPVQMQQPMMMHQPSPFQMVHTPQGTVMVPTAQPMMMQPQMMPQQQMVSNNTMFMPPARVQMHPNATDAGRITGQLPRVGSNFVQAGRRYYQPEGFDRLADSGLYIGLAVGYNLSMSGGMMADYAGQRDAYLVPGSFTPSRWQGNAMPIQFSVGAAINNDVRVDFSYMRVSGMELPGIVQTSDGAGGVFGVDATGGSITSTATMINVFYNIDAYTGVIGSGGLRPYVGFGLGIATNTISDYIVFDGGFYETPGIGIGDIPLPGTVTAISDIVAYHSGGTRENLAWMFEGGVTMEMSGGLKLDFFLRYTNLGMVQTSGNVIVTQTEWLATGLPIGNPGSEVPADFDGVFHYPGFQESGRLSMLDLGIRLRMQF